tara:strand:+ start:1708 stop:1977 length:270 start_codon:yes stop_codon:yes gene_type:complete
MTVEAKTKERPKYVQTYYTQSLEFEVDWDKLGIDYDDVEEMYVKWATLHINLVNGKQITIDEYHEFETDWKFPEKTYAYDEDMNELGEI